ncbi:hypothetical protein GCM10022631_12010 [Deinococcus rubellus]|uniref:Uncharacterized protein n=1 Tax=Deinococcus rubellus TaxID=1889240 RepID=A0ABY5YFZ6_9DEIO|nr:hypothetical protein [Deinococcus rubellus]UWX62753.1 hypothetical protein N0D28_08200 [Deinococcus rubellus]
MSYWQSRAGKVIWPIVEAGRKAGEAPKAVLAQIDAAYPFGAREHHPYKMWLAVRREAVRRLGLEKAALAPKLAPLFEEARQ